jgi:hypothetical protein
MPAFQFYLQLGKQKSRVSGDDSHADFGKKKIPFLKKKV